VLWFPTLRRGLLLHHTGHAAGLPRGELVLRAQPRAHRHRGRDRGQLLHHRLQLPGRGGAVQNVDGPRGRIKLNPVDPQLESAWFHSTLEPVKWKPGIKPLLSKRKLRRYAVALIFSVFAHLPSVGLPPLPGVRLVTCREPFDNLLHCMLQ
jgi:hypothetical protein